MSVKSNNVAAEILVINKRYVLPDCGKRITTVVVRLDDTQAKKKLTC